jgi:mannose-6-phosphate isomerase-like protein (cupin superfamily)
MSLSALHSSKCHENEILKEPINIEPIITEGKPGHLINLDIKNISEKLGIYFNINHMFYMNELDSQLSRGDHSNYNAQELLICMNGCFDITLDDGKNKKIYNIKKNQVIYVPKNVWLRFFNFKNCIILVLVDIDYKIKKESEYNYDKFLNSLK